MIIHYFCIKIMSVKNTLIISVKSKNILIELLFRKTKNKYVWKITHHDNKKQNWKMLPHLPVQFPIQK